MVIDTYWLENYADPACKYYFARDKSWEKMEIAVKVYSLYSVYDFTIGTIIILCRYDKPNGQTGKTVFSVSPVG